MLQHALARKLRYCYIVMRAERDIVVPFPSVRPSVCPMLVLCLSERTYRRTV